MRGVISAAILLICANATAQLYNIGHISVEMRDIHRGNRKIRVEIYYPESKDNRVYSKDTKHVDRFPVISFAHGYVMSPDVYGNISDAFVPEGYIVVFPYSETGIFPSHQALSEDIAFVLTETEKMGREASSPLYGITDTTCCLMGHSMGGGALFAAANLHEGTDAVVALAPMNTKPSAIQAASSVKNPTLIIAGAIDCITPPDRNQIPIYNFSASSDKTFILISGGTHCGMADSCRICTLAEKLSGCNEGLSREAQHKVLKKYIIPWLNYFLKGEVDQGTGFDNELRADTTVTWLQSRPLVSTYPSP